MFNSFFFFDSERECAFGARTAKAQIRRCGSTVSGPWLSANKNHSILNKCIDGGQRPEGNFANAQNDLKTRFRMTWPIYYAEGLTILHVT